MYHQSSGSLSKDEGCREGELVRSVMRYWVNRFWVREGQDSTASLIWKIVLEVSLEGPSWRECSARGSFGAFLDG